MRNSVDPTTHRRYEHAFVAHATSLLQDDRLKAETSAGVRPVTQFVRDVFPGDQAVAVKQKMIELDVIDRELQRNMPTGQTLDITLSNKTIFGGKTPVGRMRIVCVSPTEDLLKGEEPKPLDVDAIKKVISSQPPSLGRVPMTLVIVSTSGLTDDAKKLAERRPGERSVVLAEVNDGGGWNITAPPGLEDYRDLLDPETEAQKLERVTQALEASIDLMTGGVSAEHLASKLHLPEKLVARALKDYAEAHQGLAARSVEGTLLLYREGLSTAGGPIGDNMPFWEKVKGVFSKSESREKKVARLSQERAVLVHQRQKAYDEIETVEKKEADLTASFKAAAPLSQKRIATEIAQIRKRGERIQQLVSTIDKKINIIETGMHNLEMEQHLSKESLESLEKVAEVSENVDVGMATLDQLSESADAVSVVGSEMSGSAQDVLAELQAKFAAEEKVEKETGPAAKVSTGADRSPAQRAANTPPPVPGERGRIRGAAEPG